MCLFWHCFSDLMLPLKSSDIWFRFLGKRLRKFFRSSSTVASNTRPAPKVSKWPAKDFYIGWLIDPFALTRCSKLQKQFLKLLYLRFGEHHKIHRNWWTGFWRKKPIQSEWRPFFFWRTPQNPSEDLSFGRRRLPKTKFWPAKILEHQIWPATEKSWTPLF